MDTPRKQYPDDHWLRSEDVEEAFRKYMDQQGKAYSRVKNSFITELLGDLRGKRFLDYGCGAGIFSVHAAKAGASMVVGVDALETALNTARYHAHNEGVQGMCSFVLSKQFPSELGIQRFDVILMKDVLEHVEEDQALLEAASRAIAPGGVLVLSTQNSLSLNFLIQGGYRKGLLRERDWFGWDETHLRFYTPMGLNNLLKKAGFRSSAWRSVYLIPYKLPAFPGTDKQFTRVDVLSWVDRALGGVFPYNRLGWNIVVKAEASQLVTQHLGIKPLETEQSPSAALLVTKNALSLRQDP